jgi:hypothetical protein
MQTSLSASIAVTAPAGGEMSGLTAHFLFAENFCWFWGILIVFWGSMGENARRMLLAAFAPKA